MVSWGRVLLVAFTRTPHTNTFGKWWESQVASIAAALLFMAPTHGLLGRAIFPIREVCLRPSWRPRTQETLSSLCPSRYVPVSHADQKRGGQVRLAQHQVPSSASACEAAGTRPSQLLCSLQLQAPWHCLFPLQSVCSCGSTSNLEQCCTEQACPLASM